MSTEVMEERLRRLMSSGLRETCRPGERVSQLKKTLPKSDALTMVRMEQVFFGLADRTRLTMLNLLSQEELCSCEIQAALSLTEPTTSHHLGILERTGLTTSRREGKWVFYKVPPTTKVLMSKASALVRGAS